MPAARRGRHGGIALAALLALAGCGSDAERPAGEVQAAPARFVLVTIDTLRADRVGCYGAENAGTATLDALAGRGVRFETAIAPTPLTLPSHATLLTALDPPDHGVRGNGRFRLRDELPTLAERMQTSGFATAAFVSAFVLDRRFGLARGFDHYDDRLGVQSPDAGVASRTAEQTVDVALLWLARAPERFFLWLHLYDPHAPYEPPEPLRARHLGRPYDGEIAFADAQLGRLLAAVDARFPADETVVIATSDHGESLGEHGEPTHAFTVYDATQRVPLLMAGPGLPAGKVVSGLARLADVAPTVLELAGAPGLASPTGLSLLPLVRGESEAEPRIAWVETLATQLDFGWSPLLGVRTAAHKYVRAPRPELYALASDPGETRNLAGEQPELARELDAVVEARGAARPVAANLAVDPEVTERLRALGYVAGDAPLAQGRALGEVGGPDPKDEIGKLASTHEALELLEAGREAEALDRLLKLGEVGLELELLRGAAALAAGDLERARDSAQRSRSLDPSYAPCLVLSGRVAEAEDRLADAEAAFRGALDFDPDASDAWVGLGRVAEARGQLDAARASYERSRGLARVDPEGLWRLAALELESGRAESARAALAELPPRQARSPQAAARLARAERASGRFDLAAVRLVGALREHPEATELLLARADLAEDRGGGAAALAIRRQAHAAKPSLRSTRLALARSLALTGTDLELARELAEEALAQARSVDALELLALVQAARGEFAGALSSADEGLAKAPPAARDDLLFRRAEALAGLGQAEAAATALAEARRLAGADPRAQGSTARVEKLLSAPSS
jgi:arylsulfatase A-like enzyme/Flp pilus assembly protein TadD